MFYPLGLFVRLVVFPIRLGGHLLSHAAGAIFLVLVAPLMFLFTFVPSVLQSAWHNNPRIMIDEVRSYTKLWTTGVRGFVVGVDRLWRWVITGKSTDHA